MSRAGDGDDWSNDLMTAVIPAPDVPVCHCNARLPGHTHSATPGEIFAHVSAGGRLMLAADCNEET